MPSLSSDIEVLVPAPRGLVPGMELELGKASALAWVVVAVGKDESSALWSRAELWGLSAGEQLAWDIGALQRQRPLGLVLRRWSPFRLAMMWRKRSRRS